MELQKAIEERRSIRKFKNKDVENSLIESLIDCARKVPSAKNRQPWKYLIVKGNTKDLIAKLVGQQQMELSSAIAIGYQDEYPNPRPRKKLEKVLEWYVNE